MGKIPLHVARWSTWPALLFLSACIHAPQIVQRAEVFRESDFRGFDRHGSGSVVGRAYVKMNTGNQHPAAHQVVDLVPANAYTTEDTQIVDVQNNRTTSSPPAFLKYRRSAMTDANGNFALRGVPSGEYWIDTAAEWSYTITSADEMHDEEGQVDNVPLYARISVKDGQTTNVQDWKYGRTWTRDSH